VFWRVFSFPIGGLVGLSPLAFAEPVGENVVLRMGWGVPDQQGRWGLATMTPLDRPPGFER